MSDLHVIFGTGPLGLSVARALIERGQRVRMVSRSGKADPTLTSPGVELVAADLTSPSAAASATQGAVAAYQCAQPAYTRWAEEFPQFQAAIIDGVSQSGARLVLGDNLYMYGRMHGQPMREDSPTNAHTKKGKVRAAMAESALAAHRVGKLKVAVARGADFYGPGVRDSLFGGRTFPAMLAGKPAELTGNPDIPHTITYIRDFGTAMANIGQAEDAMGQIWHVPNAPTTSQRQFIDKAFAILNKPPKYTVLGPLMMRIGALFIPAAREVIEMMYQFTEPFTVDHSKYAARFGDHATAQIDGLRATLDWYANQPVS
ncbi:MAG: NAD-dependent epimerase/dehydratase family protein [Anaerolineae bacterium]|jgi:nucleoside-diphosphate-sugar epimerase|nr:NAD-dependent epimerase/dehydratase family protein [Anaerolineae bacterium]